MHPVLETLVIVASGAAGLALVVAVVCAALFDIVRPDLQPRLRTIIDGLGLAVGVGSVVGLVFFLGYGVWGSIWRALT